MAERTEPTEREVLEGLTREQREAHEEEPTFASLVAEIHREGWHLGLMTNPDFNSVQIWIHGGEPRCIIADKRTHSSINESLQLAIAEARESIAAGQANELVGATT